jgi:hypothetical protein
MADEEREEDVAEEAEVDLDCCQFMKQALDYSDRKKDSGSSHHTAGLVVGHLFNATSGKHTRSKVVYYIPAVGKGKERTKPLNVLINFCPFCGKPHGEEAKASREKENSSVWSDEVEEPVHLWYYSEDDGWEGPIVGHIKFRHRDSEDHITSITDEGWRKGLGWENGRPLQILARRGDPAPANPRDGYYWTPVGTRP